MCCSQNSACQPAAAPQEGKTEKRKKRERKNPPRLWRNSAHSKSLFPRASGTLGWLRLRETKALWMAPGPPRGHPVLPITGQCGRERAGRWELSREPGQRGGREGRAARASAPAAKVTCEGVGIDGLQSLQLVALLLAVICHRGPRCRPCIGATPRRQAAADTAAAGCRAGARAESGWKGLAPRLARSAAKQPVSAGSPMPRSEFDSSCLECGPLIRCRSMAARDWLERDGSRSGVREGRREPAAGLCGLRLEKPGGVASLFCAR